jgi:hypothetical protein
LPPPTYFRNKYKPRIILLVYRFYIDFKEFSIEIIVELNIFQKLPGAVAPGPPFFV